jgi:hypothetical protein
VKERLPSAKLLNILKKAIHANRSSTPGINPKTIPSLKAGRPLLFKTWIPFLISIMKYGKTSGH